MRQHRDMQGGRDALRRAVTGLGAGLLLTAALPPFGWWPLAFAGIAVLDRAIAGQAPRNRALAGYACGLGLLVPGLWWMGEFTLPGTVIAMLFFAGMFTAGPLLAGGSRWRWLGLPGAVVLVEAVRGAWPFEGVPIATVAQTQIGGPLAYSVRLGGPLLLALLTVAAGIALSAAWERAWRPAGVAAAVVVAGTALGLLAPHGAATGAVIDVALVQGGGEKGTRAVETGKAGVYEAHLAASERIRPGVDLVLWPEDVVDVGGVAIAESARAAEVARLAAELDTTVVAGAIEGAGDRFRNLAVTWDPAGRILGEYEKNVRVPFGEWIPFRSLLDNLADLSAVPRDATVGQGPGFVSTPAGDLGMVISWEVFFPRRARAAVDAGGEVLLVPTNASSFSTVQMPAIELQVARLRALETGRWTLQAAPTGFSGVIDPAGRVQQHSDLRAQQVLHATVERRTGHTPYGATGDLPVLAVAALLLGAAAVPLVRTRGARGPAAPDRPPARPGEGRSGAGAAST